MNPHIWLFNTKLLLLYTFLSRREHKTTKQNRPGRKGPNSTNSGVAPKLSQPCSAFGVCSSQTWTNMVCWSFLRILLFCKAQGVAFYSTTCVFRWVDCNIDKTLFIWFISFDNSSWMSLNKAIQRKRQMTLTTLSIKMRYIMDNSGYIQKLLQRFNSREILWFGRLYLVTTVLLNIDRFYSILATVQHLNFANPPLWTSLWRFIKGSIRKNAFIKKL